MTVSATESRIGYNGNGATTVFAFPYRFLVNTDLVVTLVRADTTQVVQTLNTDYTVTGAGDDAGGTVTMVVPPATGQQLVIVRDVPLTQETDYISGDPFPAETHERALDKLTMISQRLKSLISRSIRLSDADLLVTSTILPAPSPGSSLIWNLTGTAIVNGVSSGSFVGLSPYMEVVLGSVDAAEALTNLTAAADADVVKLTGDQTVAGVKTFSSAPIIPDAAAAQNPVSKAQLDAAIARLPVGAMLSFPGTTAPTGWAKMNGILVPRTGGWANLWAYAQSSGNLVTEAEWLAGRPGSFSTGDGSTTFRIPERRGLFDRGYHDGSGTYDSDTATLLGQYRDSQNKAHSHWTTFNVGATSGGGQYGIASHGSVSGAYGLSTSSSGGVEAYPRHTSSLWCIKL